MKYKKKNLMDTINEYDWLASLIILVFLQFLLKDKILIFYDDEISIIDNIISIFGTLFGFVLTCLSIFIVFKTDDKYTKENTSRVIGRLLSNSNFNDIYTLFIKNLYSIGIILLLSFAIYFISNMNIEIKIAFIIIYMFFICLSIIRTALSLLAFKKIIRILVESK